MITLKKEVLYLLHPFLVVIKSLEIFLQIIPKELEFVIATIKMEKLKMR